MGSVARNEIGRQPRGHSIIDDANALVGSDDDVVRVEVSVSISPHPHGNDSTLNSLKHQGSNMSMGLQEGCQGFASDQFHGGEMQRGAVVRPESTAEDAWRVPRLGHISLKFDFIDRAIFVQNGIHDLDFDGDHHAVPEEVFGWDAMPEQSEETHGAKRDLDFIDCSIAALAQDG